MFPMRRIGGAVTARDQIKDAIRRHLPSLVETTYHTGYRRMYDMWAWARSEWSATRWPRRNKLTPEQCALIGFCRRGQRFNPRRYHA